MVVVVVVVVVVVKLMIMAPVTRVGSTMEAF